MDACKDWHNRLSIQYNDNWLLDAYKDWHNPLSTQNIRITDYGKRTKIDIIDYQLKI